MRGKRVALTQPLSTCGYLGTNAILRQHAGITLEDTHYRYLNTHEAAALAVVAGDADAAGIKDEFAIKFAPLGLAIAGYSEWVPALGLFASQSSLVPERIAEVRRLLLATPPEVYRRWGNAMRYGMVTGSDADFDALRKLGDPASIPPPPVEAQAVPAR
jgi:phosphonate transport system substrate-binding protein